MDLIQKKKTNSTLVLVIGWKRELHKQHIMYKTSEVSFIIWWTTSSENIASFYSLMQNRLYWTTCPWVTVFVQLSHTKYHALHPVLNSCGLNSQAPLTTWRIWSYCLSWNVHMLTWCSDLGKNQKEWPTGLTFFYIFYFIFCMYLFSKYIYWKDSLYSIIYACFICHRIIDYIGMGLFVGSLLCFIDVCICFYVTTMAF